MSLLSKEGGVVEFRYEDPTEDMRSLGVTKGTPKFKGQKNERRYTGKAYVYSAYCSKGFDYDVKGDETADHMLITLKGKAPVRIANTCQVHHYDEKAAGSILEFWNYNRKISENPDIGGSIYARAKRENRTDSIH